MNHYILSLEGFFTDFFNFLMQRGCAVVCVKFYIWFWGALVVGFLFGWIARKRLEWTGFLSDPTKEDEDEKPTTGIYPTPPGAGRNPNEDSPGDK